MKPIATISILIATSLLLAADQTDPRFEKWMDQSRKIFATHHLIAYVRLAHIDSKKGPPFEFRYDRYPDGIERVQKPDGTSLAHQKGKKWRMSDDWGETGDEVDPDVVKQSQGMISYVDLPLKSKGESRDKSQGAVVVRMIDQRTTKEENEEIVFEQGREHQTGSNYPKFTFFRFKDAKSDDVVLSEFSGPVYDAGGGKVQLDVRYEYMIAVKMDETNVKIITPPPSPSPSHP